MRAILDRIGWIEHFIRKVAEGKPIDRGFREGVWAEVQAIRTIAEILPDSGIERLHLESGDILVIRYQQPLTLDQIHKLHDQFQKEFPENRIMVLDSGADLVVLTKAEIDARSDPARQPPGRIIELPTA